MSAYKSLEDKFGSISDIQGAMAMLAWDGYVMMPEGAGPIRAQQMATLTGVAHDALTRPALGELVAEAAREALDPWQHANLRLMRRRLRDAATIPGDLAAALAKASMETELAWRDARAADDYPALLQHFGPLLHLVREAAALRGSAFGLSPYDAALDLHQEGLREADVQAVFDDLAVFLPGLLDEVLTYQARLPEPGALPASVSVEIQRRMCEALVRQAGFDFANGRLDVAAHPFCGGVPGDVRLTTRYSEAEFLESLTGTIHETGHALYEMGLPPKWRRQPVGQASGVMIHESQSLIMEMQASLGREFTGYLAGEVRAATNQPCAGADLYRQLTHVERSLIRVAADEVTYPLHVIVRTRLERAMLAGDLDPVDLPGAWNDGMQDLLGVAPPSDSLGCLQDPHWYAGEIGYFPTYTLGAMAAAQLFQSACATHPLIREELAQGSFMGLQGWLRQNIHARASSVDGPELIRQATGKPLDPAIYKAHLRKRYLDE